MDLKILDNIFHYIDDNFADHLNKVQKFLKTPCFSTEDLGVEENVTHLRATMERLQFQHIDVVKMPRGNPVVFGEYDANADKTILVYAKYDNVGVEEKNWTYDPLNAEIADNPPFGKCIFARGAHGGHAQPQAFFNTLEAIIKSAGELPVNILYVLEGDEELGSFNLPRFVQKYRDQLKQADVMISPGAAAQDKQGKVKIQLGGPGIMYVEFECSAAHWGKGPAKFDIHPSSSPIVNNPLWHLIKALGSMTSNDGNEILIEGFYDNVIEPTPEEDKNLDALALTFDVRKEMDARGGVKQFMNNETDPKILLKQLLYRPTAYVTQLTTKLGILPSKAQAEMTVRFKPNQSTQEMLNLVRRHLDNHGFSAITFKQLGGYEWWKTNPNELIVKAVIKSYEWFGVTPEIWHIGAGGDPIAVFNRPPLSLPGVGNVALAHGAGGHSPDEYMVVEGNPPYMGLKELEKSYAMILYDYANQ